MAERKLSWSTYKGNPLVLDKTLAYNVSLYIWKLWLLISDIFQIVEIVAYPILAKAGVDTSPRLEAGRFSSGWIPTLLDSRKAN